LKKKKSPPEKNGGSLRLLQCATLDLSDVVIKGLGTGGGKYFFVDDTSKITASNCTFELVGSFTTSTGEIKAKGPMTEWLRTLYGRLMAPEIL